MNPSRQIIYLQRKSRYGWALLACVLLFSCFSDKRLELGDKAPGFQLTTQDGETFRFDPASGKIHILYFWAAWCPNCEDDFQLMDKLYKKWKKELNSPCFLAINAGQTETRIRNFVKRMKTSFPIYIDQDAKLARSFGVHGLPTYFITDKQGIVRHIILGWAEEKSLLNEIAKIE
jgi:peroxiredoxin